MQINTNEHRDFIFLYWVFQYPCRKIYTLNFRTIKKRCECGVVAKPGIATGSRSNKQGFIRERYPWIRGSNVRYTVTEQIPSAPFVSLWLLWIDVSIQLERWKQIFPFYSYNDYFR